MKKVLLILLPILLLVTWAASAATVDAEPLPEPPLKADLVIVEKGLRKMMLVADGVPFKEYVISLGDNPVGHKREEGDERTPEGRYVIDWRNPNSAYHLSLHISYPNTDDKAQAAARGVSPGGDIFIHGYPNGMGWTGAALRGIDWTDGCIAVTSVEMEEIWNLVDNGTPIEIRG